MWACACSLVQKMWECDFSLSRKRGDDVLFLRPQKITCPENVGVLYFHRTQKMWGCGIFTCPENVGAIFTYPENVSVCDFHISRKCGRVLIFACAENVGVCFFTCPENNVGGWFFHVSIKCGGVLFHLSGKCGRAFLGGGSLTTYQKARSHITKQRIGDYWYQVFNSSTMIIHYFLIDFA